jgi:predicted nuclease of predicted toxin-antitoxin system
LVLLAFHLDEQIPPALADALRSRGIDVTTTADAGLARTGDREQLAFAVERVRVLVTQDVDFLRLHAEGTPHAGIAFWRQQTRSIGDVMRRLLLIHAAMSPEDMKNRIEYL